MLTFNMLPGFLWQQKSRFCLWSASSQMQMLNMNSLFYQSINLLQNQGFLCPLTNHSVQIVLSHVVRRSDGQVTHRKTRVASNQWTNVYQVRVLLPLLHFPLVCFHKRLKMDWMSQDILTKYRGLMFLEWYSMAVMPLMTRNLYYH